jgi:IclR family acetate operon transcriptional repressor
MSSSRRKGPAQTDDQAPGDDNSPTYPIGSVDNTLKLLRMFGENKTIRIADASREIGVARSTAHRMMQMLQFHGFVRQDPSSRAYVAGEELVRIGLSVVRQIDVRVVARPALEALVAITAETAHLAERRGADIFFLDSIESPQNVRVGKRTGMTLPAYCTSTGKVLLADLDSDELRRLLPRRLPALTDKTTSSFRELEAELERTRELGYATNLGESEPDVGAVAVPIRDSLGTVRAALAISAPIGRASKAHQAEWIAALQEQAAAVSAALHT